LVVGGRAAVRKSKTSQETRRSEGQKRVPWSGLANWRLSCAIEVHKTLGPGLLESVYQEGMVIDLKGANHQHDVP
jgi:PD-(D/E)XK nuclease superfamily